MYVVWIPCFRFYSSIITIFLLFISFHFFCVCVYVSMAGLNLVFIRYFFIFFEIQSRLMNEWKSKCNDDGGSVRYTLIFVDVQCKCVWLYMKEIERMDPVKTEFQFKIYRTVVNNPRIRIFFSRHLERWELANTILNVLYIRFGFRDANN